MHPSRIDEERSGPIEVRSVLPTDATRGLNIRIRLSLIVVAVAIPLLLLSAGIVWQLAEIQRDTSRQALMFSARSIRSAVDAQLGRYIAVAQMLAASPALKIHNLALFREEADRALPGLPGSWVILIDRSGQQVVNTRVGQGRPLPGASQSVQHAIDSASKSMGVAVSDLHVGPATKTNGIVVVVPELTHGEPVNYFVGIAVRADAFAALLNAQRMPRGWLAGIIDSAGNIIARSRDHERFVGRPAAAGWRAVMQQETTFETASLDGQRLVDANTPSPLSGWAVAVGVEKGVLEAPIRRTVVVASLIALAVTLLSVLLAARAARKIITPIKALETGAQALESHQPVPLAPTGVPEVDHALHAFNAASKALTARERALKGSEERMRLFVEQAPASIIMLDRELRCIAASRRWVGSFCADGQDVVGRAYYELLPEIPEYWRERHRRALGGEAQSSQADPLVRADGRTQWVNSELRPWFAPDGTVGGIVIFAEDITDKRRAEEEHRLLQAELLHTTRLSEIGRMAAAFAHELNQPLTAVATYIGGCRRILAAGVSDEGRNRKLREVMEQANIQALRAGDIIRRLREFIGAGQRERTIENAAEMLREASALAFTAARHGGISVRTNVDTNAHVLMDKVQFQQVIVNLVRNAIEAMESTPRKELELGVTAGSDWVEFSVSDTGSGIAPDMADRLFRPFSTTKSNGMGIGLSVCREIIEAHDGKIWAEPNSDGGTAFRFTLPLVSEELLHEEPAYPPAAARKRQ